MATQTKVDVDLAKKMGLTEDEFKQIEKLIGRTPNYTELGVFSAMWSEHCSYKSSKKLFEHFPTKGKQVLVGAGEGNSGIVDIGSGLAAAFKIESHNHPSAVAPFEASVTGLGGCARDIFTTGAKPVACLSALRFGSLDKPRVKFLFKEVIKGLAHYANTAEINAVGGEVYFDDSYENNPLVNAFVIGIVKSDNMVKDTASGKGDSVYYIGGDTGRDGVRETSSASKEITEESASDKNSVAKADAELGKRLKQACLELIEKNFIVGMQDMGVAGLTCSTCKTAARGKAGIEIDIANIPLREDGMTPYEILLSESRERMLVVLTKEQEKEALDILKKWNINAVKIGKMTDDEIFRVKKSASVVCEIPLKALTKEVPVYTIETKKPKYLKKAHKLGRENIKEPEDFNGILLRLLDLPTIASKESVYEKFTVIDKDEVLVDAGSDAAVIKVKDTKKALAISVDCNARFCYLNPYNGAMMAVAEAARNVVCAGGRPLAISDGLNFGNPMNAENYWQFEQCIEGLSFACNVLNTPVISGNVSLYENPKGAIEPTPVIGMVGLIENAKKYITQDFKNEGDLIVLLGECKADLSGSEYLYLIHKQKKGNPDIDMDREKALQETCLEAIKSDIVNSAHDCSEGGLAVTLSECCISNKDKMLGAQISLNDIKNSNIRVDEILFGESPSRIVISLNKDNLSHLEKIAKRFSVPYYVLGKVSKEKLFIKCKEEDVIDIPLSKLSDAWRKAIPGRLGK